MIISIDGIWQFSNVLKLRHFWKSFKSNILAFKVILSNKSPCKTFSSIEKIIVQFLVEIIMFFTCYEKVHFFFYANVTFLRKSAVNKGRIVIRIKMLWQIYWKFRVVA